MYTPLRSAASMTSSPLFAVTGLPLIVMGTPTGGGGASASVSGPVRSASVMPHPRGCPGGEAGLVDRHLRSRRRLLLQALADVRLELGSEPLHRRGDGRDGRRPERADRGLLRGPRDA